MNIEEEWAAVYGGREPAELARLVEGNARQARKRVAADALIRDPDGRLLLVDPAYKPDWDLPGGMAEANESPKAALQRELTEELDLDLPVGDMLCVDWVSPHGPWDDLLAFVFDGGVLRAEQATTLRIVDPELRAVRFCTPAEAAGLLRPYVWRRAKMALQVLAGRQGIYLEEGQ